MSKDGKWIGIDLDGTLARSEEQHDAYTIGEPLHPMVERAKKMIKDGHDVRIFTARVGMDDGRDMDRVHKAIGDWTEKHLGKRLPVTNVKDDKMHRLYDDRAIGVVRNKGTLLHEEGKKEEYEN